MDQGGATQDLFSESKGHMSPISKAPTSASHRTILNSPLQTSEDDITLPSYCTDHVSVSDDERLSPFRPRRLQWTDSHEFDHYERHDRQSHRADAVITRRLKHSLDNKVQQAFGRDAQRIRTRRVSQRHVMQANKSNIN